MLQPTTPSPAATEEITQLLLAWGQGDQAALEQLLPLVYEEMRQIAHHHMRRQRPDHTLQTTALVNEAYLRLVDAQRVQWQNRVHFFALAAQAMRHILVDLARARGNQKRGGGATQVALEEALIVSAERGADVLALDEALQTLAKLNARQSQIVELRYFGGLSEEETAAVLQLSPRTVRRDWSLARAWLYRELNRGQDDDA
ncbi:MAG: sigma-70 family RNA polymerase sigma factor [Acidobacteria bacterium]|nr:sigma-70 family RNA polymerase sigma factor [Acidobacteriota bacterium]